MNHREETLQRTNPAVRDLSYPAERALAAKKLIIPNEISFYLSLSFADTTLTLSPACRSRGKELPYFFAAEIVPRAEHCADLETRAVTS